MKKLLTAGVALLSVATLVACSGKTASESSSKDAKASSSKVEKSSTSESKSSSSSKTSKSSVNVPEVVLLTDEEYSMDGAIIYRTKKFENLSGSADCEGDADGQLRLITDSNYALTGELQDKETSTCLYSANPNLVRLLKDALANEIRLIEIEKKDASI